MAVKITQLPAVSPNGSLVLPVSDGITTSKVTVSQVCGVMTAGQITTSLGYTPYNSTNPSGYISSSIVTLATGRFPSIVPPSTAYPTFTFQTGSLANYKILKLSIRNVSFSQANSRIQLTDPLTEQSGLSPYISHNNGTGLIFLDCTIDLISGTLVSVSENGGQEYDSNGSYVFMKSHNYTPASTFVKINSSASSNYIMTGTYYLLGLK